ncbi:hypothetical protein C8R45DRAFT_1220614 [Mycena sanguinolenta]|nr:hypothetical protein C8R45DRAFT_1220614 [Mycena sanguinolenta]
MARWLSAPGTHSAASRILKPCTADGSHKKCGHVYLPVFRCCDDEAERGLLLRSTEWRWRHDGVGGLGEDGIGGRSFRLITSPSIFPLLSPVSCCVLSCVDERSRTLLGHTSSAPQSAAIPLLRRPQPSSPCSCWGICICGSYASSRWRGCLWRRVSQSAAIALLGQGVELQRAPPIVVLSLSPSSSYSPSSSVSATVAIDTSPAAQTAAIPLLGYGLELQRHDAVLSLPLS